MVALAVGIALSAACARGGAAPGGSQDVPITVTVVRPERRTLARTLRIPASVQALQEATLYAKAAGYLSRIMVDRGDRVRAGQVLAEISVPETANEKDVVAAQLRQAEAELHLQQITVERLGTVRATEPGAVTQQQVDETRAKLQVAEAAVAQLSAELARVQALIDYATIRAPFSGIVTDRFVDAGAMIQTAATSTQAPIVTVMDMDTVRVFVDVPEPDVPYVTRTTPARLTVGAIAGREFVGSVTRYSTALDPKTRTMRAEIDVSNRDHALRPGMFGAATLELQRREGALTLPAAALLTEKDVAYVYTVQNDAARRTPVKIGLDDGIVVEVLSGLAGAESVIVGGKGIVTDGTRVRVGSSS